ncbi:hypothetical protein SeLEV6574_g08218 [Synchytrium endobioticum]|nr:hypothetical protein SeLEV6574_g08218 [Synchytrium endobioticum]
MRGQHAQDMSERECHLTAGEAETGGIPILHASIASSESMQPQSDTGLDSNMLPSELKENALVLKNVQFQLEKLRPTLSLAPSLPIGNSDVAARNTCNIESSVKPSIVDSNAIIEAAEAEISRLRQCTIELTRLKADEVASIQTEWDDQKRNYLATLSTLRDSLYEAANASDVMKAAYEHMIAETKAREKRLNQRSTANNCHATLTEGLSNIKERIAVDADSLNELLGQLPLRHEGNSDAFVKIAGFLSKYFSLFGGIIELIKPEALETEVVQSALRILSDNPLFTGSMATSSDDNALTLSDVNLGGLMLQFMEEGRQLSTSMIQIRSFKHQAITQPLVNLESSWHTTVEQRAYLLRLVQHLMKTVVRLRASQKSKNAAIEALRDKPKTITSTTGENSTPKASYDSEVNKLQSELAQAYSALAKTEDLEQQRDALVQEVEELQAHHTRETKRIEALSVEIETLQEANTKLELEVEVSRRIKPFKATDHHEEGRNDTIAKLSSDLSRLHTTYEQEKARYVVEMKQKADAVEGLLVEREIALSRMEFAFTQMRKMEAELATLALQLADAHASIERRARISDVSVKDATRESQDNEPLATDILMGRNKFLEAQLVDNDKRFALLHDHHKRILAELSATRIKVTQMQYDMGVLRESTVPRCQVESVSEEVELLLESTSQQQEVVQALQQRVRNLDIDAARLEAERDTAQSLVASLRARLDDALKDASSKLVNYIANDSKETGVGFLLPCVCGVAAQLGRLNIENRGLLVAVRARDFMLAELRERLASTPAPSKTPLIVSKGVQVNEKKVTKACKHAATLATISTSDKHCGTDFSELSIQTDVVFFDAALHVVNMNEIIEEEHTIERSLYVPVVSPEPNGETLCSTTHHYSESEHTSSYIRENHGIEAYQNSVSASPSYTSTLSYTPPPLQHTTSFTQNSMQSSFIMMDSHSSSFLSMSCPDALQRSDESLSNSFSFPSSHIDEAQVEKEIAAIKKASAESLKQTAATLSHFYSAGGYIKSRKHKGDSCTDHDASYSRNLDSDTSNQ